MFAATDYNVTPLHPTTRTSALLTSLPAYNSQRRYYAACLPVRDIRVTRGLTRALLLLTGCRMLAYVFSVPRRPRPFAATYTGALLTLPSDARLKILRTRKISLALLGLPRFMRCAAARTGSALFA